ncbi:site-specific DNA-methyltransferase [Chryseolinea sp. H1M3-3]|uniref:site-specific DNA-methyltransferase n=1 Tax=Chryseolinea sp. H1M3-3 TaxID=3034144 RepID=UPI0023EBCB79|nr:site-specific DNA-methyltransferase [Chryseolinea sp. H1M3-3]
MAKKTPVAKTVEALKHDEAKRKNIPTAEYQSVLQKEEQDPIRVSYERRNRDLDPQLVWRGKDEQDWSELVVHAPPLYIQEKIHPKVLIDDLLRQTKEQEYMSGQIMADLFSDFNGIPKGVDRTEFYQHDQNWSNRMILGDSLQVMASLAEREGLRGKVQCIYFDPPYGIKFNSNFQWSTTSRDVKDGNTNHITREPEQVKAFRDTWRDGIHSYLTYLRDRMTVARDLLTDSGSIFVQIGDENVHRVRTLMDEIFGESNAISLISYPTSVGLGSQFVENVNNYIVWYAKDREAASGKCKQLYKLLERGEAGATRYSKILDDDMRVHEVSKLSESELSQIIENGGHFFTDQGLTSRSASSTTLFEVIHHGRGYKPTAGGWRTSQTGMNRVQLADRILKTSSKIRFRKNFDDFGALSTTNNWDDVSGGIQTRNDPKVYVVQTATSIVQRCILMATDPGDLVLDPTCGSGTTATVAEQWGRRWITVDTSRVALALARTRIMGARYPFYILADSKEGQVKEAELTRSTPSSQSVHGNIRHGFIYERVPHITLKSIANNSEIEVIWGKWQDKLEPIRAMLNKTLKQSWHDWEIPREPSEKWSVEAKKLHDEWWKARITRQKEIDASIAAKAEFEYLFDRPYEDKKKARVAGPFTVESLSPHRTLGVDENDELIDPLKQNVMAGSDRDSFANMVLENLKTAGVQQAHKEDKIAFSSVVAWPGDLVCGEGRYLEGDKERRAAIFIGPEFGTVLRADLVSAAREAGDAGFDVLISCAFNYEAHTTEFNKLGRIPVLKARMNADLHMADDLKNTGKGNLFVIFGEPDINIIKAKDDHIQIKVNGVDVFDPNTGKVRSDNSEGIACWFIDTDYNEESFFVRHAYFLGANDPYSALKSTLKAEINHEAWESLNSDISRPFPKPKTGRIAVKVINHLGDEVMKVFKID